MRSTLLSAGILSTTYELHYVSGDFSRLKHDFVSVMVKVNMALITKTLPIEFLSKSNTVRVGSVHTLILRM